MATRNPARNARPPAPAPAPAANTLPVYNSVVAWWTQRINQAPYNRMDDGSVTTVAAIDEQLMQYQRIINDPVVDHPYSSAPITVKNYRVERWAWYRIYGRHEDGPLKFPGIDPEPEVVRLRMWTPPQVLLEYRARNPAADPLRPQAPPLRYQPLVDNQPQQQPRQMPQQMQNQQQQMPPPQPMQPARQMQQQAGPWAPHGPPPMSATREDIIAAKGADYVPMWGWTGTGDVPKYSCFTTAERSYNALVGVGRHPTNLRAIHRLYPGVKIMYQKLRNRRLVVWLECWDDAAAVRLNSDDTQWRTFCQCYDLMFAWTRQTGVAMNVVDFREQYLASTVSNRVQQTLNRPGNPAPRPVTPPLSRPAVNRADRIPRPAASVAPAVRHYRTQLPNVERENRTSAAAASNTQFDEVTYTFGKRRRLDNPEDQYLERRRARAAELAANFTAAPGAGTFGTGSGPQPPPAS